MERDTRAIIKICAVKLNSHILLIWKQIQMIKFTQLVRGGARITLNDVNKGYF